PFSARARARDIIQRPARAALGKTRPARSSLPVAPPAGDGRMGTDWSPVEEAAMRGVRRLSWVAVLGLAAWASAGERAGPSAERGKHALLERAFTPATWTPRAYQNAWKRWPGAG